MRLEGTCLKSAQVRMRIEKGEVEDLGGTSSNFPDISALFCILLLTNLYC